MIVSILARSWDVSAVDNAATAEGQGTSPTAKPIPKVFQLLAFSEVDDEMR